MPIVEPGSFNIVLDPAEVADTGRVQLFLNEAALMVMFEGIDWGDAAIQAYQADQQVGSTPVDYRLPNRTVTIPLLIGGDNDPTGFAEAKGLLQQKVALFQREGGWIKRGDVGLYADVVNATLHKPDKYGEAGAVEPDVSLVLECLPDFYGDMVTLDAKTAGGIVSPVLQQSGVNAVIAGDHPGRCIIVLTDGSGVNQRGVIWGFRSRYYDAATTAKTSYDTTLMTPINGAVSATVAGAWDATAITVVPVANTWHPFLSTDLLVGGQLTHQGTYGVWARCTTDTAGMSLRLLWSLDDTTSPVFNNIVQLPLSGYSTQYTLEHLGNIRVDVPPVAGAHWWRGVIQAFATGSNQNLAVDELFLVPLDESAGFSSASSRPPSFALSDTRTPTAAANNAAVGTVAWSNPNNIFVEDTSDAAATVPSGAQTEYLTASGYGFGLPVGATVTGILVQVAYNESPPDPLSGGLTVHLMKAGVVQTASIPGSYTPSFFGRDFVAVYGDASDLWSQTWTGTEINNSGFGVAISWTNPTSSSVDFVVNNIEIQVFYTTGGGFTVVKDAVINANRVAHVRTEGVFREDATGSSSAFVAVGDSQGDLPRIPPSGMEARPVELFVKTSRGDLRNHADNSRDTFTAQVIYRPSYLFPA